MAHNYSQNIFHKCLIVLLFWGSIGWNGSRVWRRTKWAPQERKYYLICTHVTFSNILCGCYWVSICQISTERTKTSDSGNSRNILLLAGKRNKIKRTHFLSVICYWYVFYLIVLNSIKSSFNHFPRIFLNNLILLNFFIITITYFKYIWQCAFLFI